VKTRATKPLLEPAQTRELLYSKRYLAADRAKVAARVRPDIAAPIAQEDRRHRRGVSGGTRLGMAGAST
jgi:hypothetical protein